MVNSGGSGSLSCAWATLGWSTRAALNLCLVHRLLWDGQLGRLWVSACAQAILGWSTRAALGLCLVHRLLWDGLT